MQGVFSFFAYKIRFLEMNFVSKLEYLAIYITYYGTCRCLVTVFQELIPLRFGHEWAGIVYYTVFTREYMNRPLKTASSLSRRGRKLMGRR